MLDTLILHFPTLNPPQSYKMAPHEKIVVGKTTTCDLNLADYFETDILLSVSRKHFEISYQNKQFIIVDVSLNGTFVNTHRLLKGKPRPLYHGDVVHLTNNQSLTIEVQLEDATQPLAITDPYTKHILKQIQAHKDVILLGLPGAGKTTLLRGLLPTPELLSTPEMLSIPLPHNRDFIFCYINAMAIDDPSPSSFFKLFIAATKPTFQQWPSKIRQNYQQVAMANSTMVDIQLAVLDTLKLVHHHHGKHLVILLDQFDDVYDELPSSVFAILKAVKQFNPAPIFVIATRNKLSIINDYVEQFLRVITNRHEYWLPPFDDVTLTGIIQPYQLNNKQIKLCLNLGNKQPRLTSLIGKYFSHTNTVIPANLQTLLKDLLQDMEIGHHCYTIWQSLSVDEQAALQSVAMGEAKMTHAIEELLTNCKFLLDAEGQSFGQTEVFGQTFDFVSPLYKVYIQSLANTTSIEQTEPLDRDFHNKSSTTLKKLGGLLFDETMSQFMVNGQLLPIEDLAPLEREMLLYLYKNYGRVCTYIQIWEQVWGYPDDLAFEKGTIARVASNIRRKLEATAPGSSEQYLHTIRGEGYKLTRH